MGNLMALENQLKVEFEILKSKEEKIIYAPISGS